MTVRPKLCWTTMPIPTRDQPSYHAVLRSRTAQRAPPPSASLGPGSRSFERSGAIILGPGSYTPKWSEGGHAAGGRLGPEQWSIDPRRQNSSFKSQTQKGKLQRPLTADCNHGRKYGVSANYIKWLQGDVPGAAGRQWGKDARRPPHTHIKSRAYPFEGGEPKGRDVGLDVFYEVDNVVASPIGLHATLAVNMKRTDRTYASSFRSKAPARPRTASQSTPDTLGPGSHNTNEYTAVVLKNPNVPSPWARPFSGGMMKGVGGVYEHHDLY